MPRHIINDPKYLGANLRRLRSSRDWTVERTAKAAGISKGYVSLVESGKRTPHWTVIMRIVHGLGETLCGFFTRAESIDPPEDGIRTRRTDRIVIEGETPDDRGNLPPNPKGYTHILTPYHSGIRTEMVEIHLPPHTEWTPEPISFDARVTAYGVRGRLLMVGGGTEYIMHEGETLFYDARRPHSLRNYTDHSTLAVLAVEPVGF